MDHGHRLRHLVLVDAQWLPRFALVDVVGLAAATGVELWLVSQHPLDDAYLEALSDWPTEQLPPSALVGLLGPTKPAPAQADFPAVPPDNYPSFRAEARRRLDDEAFAVVDGSYRAAYERAKAWFGGGQVVDEANLLLFVRSEVSTCACAEETVVAVRGLQAAAHRAGWLVSADVTQLMVTAEQPAQAAVHRPATWQRLLVYRAPYRGAACALAGCGLALETMTRVTLDDVDPDGSGVDVERLGVRERVEVPDGADLYLRAQVAHRRIQGASGDDVLFGTEEGPMAERYLADAIRCPLTEVGVALFTQRVQRAELDAKRWAQRWGLSVQELS